MLDKLKQIPTKVLVGGGLAILVATLVATALAGPKLVSYLTVGYGGDHDKLYSTSGFETGIEFAPNMYHSEANDPYSQWKPSIFKDGKNMQAAPAGTIARKGQYVAEDYTPYHIPNTPEGYEAAASFRSPIFMMTKEDSTRVLVKGDTIYKRNCAICHGEKGDGNGYIVERGKYPTPGAYSSKAGLTEGQMFHSITYGKNLMGSYASQISPQQRWEVIAYIRHNFMKNMPATTAPATPVKDVKADPKKEVKPVAKVVEKVAKPSAQPTPQAKGAALNKDAKEVKKTK